MPDPIVQPTDTSSPTATTAAEFPLTPERLTEILATRLPSLDVRLTDAGTEHWRIDVDFPEGSGLHLLTYAPGELLAGLVMVDKGGEDARADGLAMCEECEGAGCDDCQGGFVPFAHHWVISALDVSDGMEASDEEVVEKTAAEVLRLLRAEHKVRIEQAAVLRRLMLVGSPCSVPGCRGRVSGRNDLAFARLCDAHLADELLGDEVSRG